MKIYTHEFVEFIPKFPEEGILYISLRFCTVVHKCACGCGNKVVTPLSPNDWKLIFNGDAISLYPSIGNWSFECKSHYWIAENTVKWARRWNENKKYNNLNKEQSEIEVAQKRIESHKTLIWNFFFKKNKK